MENNTGIYIHIPFCERKCIYCDFLSFHADRYGEMGIKSYFEVLEKEIEKKKLSREITSIFIGGGTPSVVNSLYIYDFLSKINNSFKISSDAEITIEVNPGTIQEPDFKVYKEAGVNRISFGVQSMDNSLLKFLKRIHTKEDFLKAAKHCHNSGITNISCDLLIGVPTQSIDTFKSTINEIIALDLTHVSAYSLILEENTKITKLIDKGQITPVSDDVDRKMYYLCKEYLENAGFNQYEISNFSKEGYESKHNLLYWNCNEYLGFGLGASSYLDGVRYKNTSSMDEYLRKDFSKHQIDVLDKEEKMNEFMMLGFRLTKGPSPELFFERFNSYYHIKFKPTLDKLQKRGLVKSNSNNSYFLTELGLDLANQVFMEFV